MACRAQRTRAAEKKRQHAAAASLQAAARGRRVRAEQVALYAAKKVGPSSTLSLRPLLPFYPPNPGCFRTPLDRRARTDFDRRAGHVFLLMT